MRCVAVVYADYPTAKWTFYLKNGGAADTPILTDVLPLDVHFASIGGRPINRHLPNYNIEWGDSGVIAVIGWPGQWASR